MSYDGRILSEAPFFEGWFLGSDSEPTPQRGSDRTVHSAPTTPHGSLILRRVLCVCVVQSTVPPSRNCNRFLTPKAMRSIGFLLIRWFFLMTVHDRTLMYCYWLDCNSWFNFDIFAFLPFKSCFALVIFVVRFRSRWAIPFLEWGRFGVICFCRRFVM